MASNLTKFLLGSVSGLALSFVVVPTVIAQEQSASDNSTTLEEIIVTGDLVSRSLFDTAASVAVLSEEELDEKVENTSVRDVIANIPNLHYSSSPGLNGAPTIRGSATEGPNVGAGAFFAGTIPRASFNVDGRNLSYNEMVFGSASIWDLDSIEVFRGPQTTSRGANAIAGAINVKTKDPVFDNQAALQAQYGSRNGWRTSAMVNGELIEGQLAARLTGDMASKDTYIDFTNSALTDLNDKISSRNLRLKLLWTPESIPDLEAKLTLSHSGSTGLHNEAATPVFTNLQNNDTSAADWESDTNAAVLDLDYAVSDALSLSNQFQISDTETTRATHPSVHGSAEISRRDLSNETRAMFELMDGRLSGVAGVFARHTKSDDLLYMLDATRTARRNTFDDTKKSLGIYSELTYRLTDKLSATAGLRYQHDEIERIGTITTALAANVPMNYSKSFNEILPKLSLAYDISSDWTVGGLISKGYNPGGVSYGIFSNSISEFEKETVWNYELFTRASLLDDRLMLTGNVFYSKYKDAQRAVLTSSPFPGSFDAVTYNADKAETYGAEISARFDVLDNVSFNGSVGLLQTEITKFTNSSASFDLTGKKFGKSPELTASLGVDWEMIDGLLLSANAKYVSGYYSDDYNTVAYKTDPYVVANAKISYQINDNLKVFGAVNNIFDDDTATYIMNNRARFPVDLANMNAPREFSAGLRLDF